MSRFIVAGDWHGRMYAAKASIRDAVNNDVKIIIQVGDFGVPFFTSGNDFLGDVQDEAYYSGVTVYFIDGNHENFGTIDSWLEKADRNEDGHIALGSHLFYVPRGTVWEWDGRSFAALGGAASIDKDRRTEFIDWFPQELITAGESYTLLDNIDKYGKRIDYLFTHDAATRSPFGFKLLPDRPSLRNREVIDSVLDYMRPKFHFHGHYHKWMHWDNNGTKTFGLNLENERNSRVLVDGDSVISLPWKPYRTTVDITSPLL